MLERDEVEKLLAAGAPAELCRAYLALLDAPVVSATAILAPMRAEMTAEQPVWGDWSEEGRRYRLVALT